MKKVLLYRYLLFLILGLSILVSGCGKSEEDYKKTAVPINYEEFARNPDSFKDKVILFTGNVNNVKENGKEVELLFISGKTPILAHYKLKDKEERIVANDTVRVYGEFQKVSSKKLVELAAETSVIEVDAKYILRPSWGFMATMFSHNAWTTKEDGNVNPLDSKSTQLSLSVKKINPDNIDITGTVNLQNAYFNLKGIIDDSGIGEFEYVDKEGKGLGIKGKIKINNKNEIELETAKIQQEIPVGFLHFGGPQDTTTVTIDSGKYIFKSK